jgi:hypothetical protein
MSLILFILGILVTAAGIVTIGFGIPINEFNLGNTLIVAGTTAAAAGLILIGLAAAVDQLNQIAKALRPRAGARPVLQPQAAEQAAARPVPVQAPAQPPVHAPVQAPVPGPVRPPIAAPPRPPVFAKVSAEERIGEAVPEEAVPEAPFSAIERLRSSLARADRKSGEVEDAEGAEGVSYAPAVPPPAAPTGLGSNRDANRDANRGAIPGTNGGAPAAGAGAVEATKKPALDFLFRSKSREPQPEAFDAVWPKRGPRRSDEASDADQSARPAPTEAPIERPAPSEPYAPDEIRPAAILKSGVVDGMAYTLYADGSIEAQLPQGTVRFGSIAELRSHIENNS